MKARSSRAELRAHGVTSPQRLPGSDTPTFKEQGLDVVLTNWRSVVAAPGITDAQQARRLRDAIERMVKSKQWQEDPEAERQWDDAYLAGDQFATYLKTEVTTRVDRRPDKLGLIEVDRHFTQRRRGATPAAPAARSGRPRHRVRGSLRCAGARRLRRLDLSERRDLRHGPAGGARLSSPIGLGVLAIGNLVDGAARRSCRAQRRHGRGVADPRRASPCLIAVIGVGGGFIIATTEPCSPTTATAFGRRAILTDARDRHSCWRRLSIVAFDKPSTLTPAGRARWNGCL